MDGSLRFDGMRFEALIEEFAAETLRVTDRQAHSFRRKLPRPPKVSTTPIQQIAWNLGATESDLLTAANNKP